MINNLKVKRDEQNLTQKYVADELGIIESSYARYERGESEPSAQRAIAIAKILKTTVEELYKID